MEFNDNIGTNIHGVEVGILDEYLFMAKELPVTGESTMILQTEDMTAEQLMNYLNIESFAEFDQFNEDFLWQMYRKEDAYVHYFLDDKERGREIEYHLSISNGRTIVENVTDESFQELYQMLDSVAKIEAHFLKTA